jgi:PAS domain S-box-containing protein
LTAGEAGGHCAGDSGDRMELLPLLRASEQQFLAVVANIPGAVYRCACNADWEIRFMSEHIERICGFPASDFVGNKVRSYGSIIHPGERPYVIEEIDRALKGGSPYSLQYRVIHADGSVRWVSERGRAVLGGQGERLWLDGVILDVTEQVLAEQARDRAHEAENRLVAELKAREEAKRDFFATVSHELRAPLTAIEGYVELLSDQEPAQTLAQRRKTLGMISRNALRLRALVDDIFTLARLEAGEAAMTTGAVNIAEVIAEAVTAVQPSAAAKDLSLTRTEPNQKLIIEADADQIERVLVNLLSNAVKYTPKEGRIQVAATAEDRFAVVRVMDTGIGIPMQEQSELFGRFFRASNARQKSIPGTGLGLAIVRTIVVNHGGEIAIDSEEDRGTTVTVRLPLESHHGGPARGTRAGFHIR